MLIFVGLVFKGLSQKDNIRVQVITSYAGTAVHLGDSAFNLGDAHQTKIEVLKFYLSKIQFLKNNKVVLEEQNSYHLYDASIQNPLEISIKNTQHVFFDQIRFQLGIDSLTNVSGALGGALDPTKGMYWTWQNGYINFKLEGKSALCKTRQHEFLFHLGGYQDPYNCLQKITLTTSLQPSIYLQLDLQKIISQLELEKVNQVMSPSKETLLLSEIVAHSFSIAQP